MATLYISPTGNDSTGDGTTGTPWKTLSKATTEASADDTIFMKPGTYTGMGATVVYLDQITITADINTVEIDLSAYTGAMFRADGDYTVENIKISNYSTGNNSSSNTNSLFGHYVNGATGVLRRLTIASPRLSCRLGYSRGGLVASNYSIYERNSMDITIDRCWIYDILQYGAATGVGYVFSIYDSILTVTNSVFEFGVASGSDTAAAGLFNYDNSTIMTFKNNIINNVSGETVEFTRSGLWQSMDYDYNCNYLMDSPPSGTGNITDAPLFVDPSTENYDLQPGSPCIDAGTIL